MANVYVYSGAGGAGTGADWANAYTILSAALTAKAAGDDFWVAQDHAETTAGAVTLASPGTISNPCKIQCVSRAGSVPPVEADRATTATLKTSGANAISMTGYAYSRGVSYESGSGNASSAAGINIITGAGRWSFEDCSLYVNSTGSSPVLAIGPNSVNNASCFFKNVIVKFANVGGAINAACGRLEWFGGSVDAAGSIPTVLFLDPRASLIEVAGVDLSALGSGKTIMGVLANNNGRARFRNCKLGASVTRIAQQTTAGADVQFIRCDDGDTAYKDDCNSYWGSRNIETTIVRTGGASDGTTPIAHKIVTTANAKWISPFRAPPIEIWNETLSAITITLQGIWGGGAVPNNDDIWLEVEYPGDASTPKGSFVNDGKVSNFASNAAQTAGSGTWGGSTTKFSLDVTITPANKGPLRLYVMCGAASGTFYIDPKPVIT